MIPEMGRPKTVFLDLPPRMTARKGRNGTVRYYYGQGKLALGSDINKARIKWAELENGGIPSGTRYQQVSERWEKEELHKRAPKTQHGYLQALKQLYPAFKDFNLDQIQAQHVRQYLDRRSKKIAANREIAVLSAIWNWAREVGLTNQPNPVNGVKRHKEHRREKYVTDVEYLTAWEKASTEIQDAMDLAYLTGQRVGDVLKMVRQDIRDGALWVRQNKTGARVGIRLEGELKNVMERILTRPRTVQSIYLVCDVKGQKLTPGMFHKRWLATGADWQFRDLRAKAATDAGNLGHAQRLLGHSTETTTAKIYRRVKGNLVSPLK